jgi:hypothetical protein
MVAVSAVCGLPSQLRIADTVPLNLLSLSDSYGRLRRIVSGNIQVATRLFEGTRHMCTSLGLVSVQLVLSI